MKFLKENPHHNSEASLTASNTMDVIKNPDYKEQVTHPKKGYEGHPEGKTTGVGKEYLVKGHVGSALAHVENAPKVPHNFKSVKDAGSFDKSAATLPLHGHKGDPKTKTEEIENEFFTLRHQALSVNANKGTIEKGTKFGVDINDANDYSSVKKGTFKIFSHDREGKITGMIEAHKGNIHAKTHELKTSTGAHRLSTFAIGSHGLGENSKVTNQNFPGKDKLNERSLESGKGLAWDHSRTRQASSVSDTKKGSTRVRIVGGMKDSSSVDDILNHVSPHANDRFVTRNRDYGNVPKNEHLVINKKHSDIPDMTTSTDKILPKDVKTYKEVFPDNKKQD
jgi:hypothetical protein